jgi:3'-phosphoadenosine 5'-phosphosulfate sulfotransferase (PAPS reductase)/FAD synthetase
LVQKANTIEELLQDCPVNSVIGDNLIRAWSKINSDKYNTILCSISGGSDSDEMLDIIWRCDKDNKVTYVWFDTGLEYQATKDHLKYLEQKYNIKIQSYRAIKPIPVSCKQYGQPFISKQVSDYISRLQKHNFRWEDKSFEELYKEYPKCKTTLQWWCNEKQSDAFNIRKNKYLKEFLIKYPPDFKISMKCCQYAKKDVMHKLIKDMNCDLHIMGVRKAEGGVRSTAYKSCFSESDDGCDHYRPLFWYKNSDKDCYDAAYAIEHSRCYTEYGLERTGCAGCPFGRNFEYELEIIEKYEPKLYKAVNNIFGNSYEYTRKYKQFCKEMKKNDSKKSITGL